MINLPTISNLDCGDKPAVKTDASLDDVQSFAALIGVPVATDLAPPVRLTHAGDIRLTVETADKSLPPPPTHLPPIIYPSSKKELQFMQDPSVDRVPPSNQRAAQPVTIATTLNETVAAPTLKPTAAAPMPLASLNTGSMDPVESGAMPLQSFASDEPPTKSTETASSVSLAQQIAEPPDAEKPDLAAALIPEDVDVMAFEATSGATSQAAIYIDPTELRESISQIASLIETEPVAEVKDFRMSLDPVSSERADDILTVKPANDSRPLDAASELKDDISLQVLPDPNQRIYIGSERLLDRKKQGDQPPTMSPGTTAKSDVLFAKSPPPPSLVPKFAARPVTDAQQVADAESEAVAPAIVSRESLAAAAVAPRAFEKDIATRDVAAVARLEMRSAMAETATEPISPTQAGERLNLNVLMQIEPKLHELAALTNASGRQTLKIRLKPAELGNVLVTLDKDQSGRLSAHLQPDNEAARFVLDRTVAQLRTSLENSGFQVGEVKVSLSTSTNGGQHGSGRQFDEAEFFGADNFISGSRPDEPDDGERLISLRA